MSDPQALRSVLGAGLYLAVLGLLGLGLGTLIRRTAGAVAAVAGLVQGLPSSWQDAITRYLPSAAGQAIIGRTKFAPPGPLLSPGPGFALFCAYAAAVLIAAGIVVNRRDT
jgi:ABC-2 type transport system permease protein